MEVLTDVVAESLTAEGGSLTTHGGYAESLTGSECGLAGVPADVMHVGRAPLDSHPAHGRIGDNNLLATKVAIPLDGEIRTNTGVLGSNSFEIPRPVQGDTRMAHLKRGQQRHAITTKNRYDFAGMGLFLLARWFLFYVISLVLLTTADLYGSLGAAVIAAVGVLTLLFGIFLQSHAHEDDAFVSDHITIGAGYTLGVGSLVHYGVTMGEGTVLAPDSFLMKGGDVPPYARWGGNPAREIDGNRASAQVGGK
jgi:acetyltransferase-like isoleucine patch superfamily enzyme